MAAPPLPPDVTGSNAGGRPSLSEFSAADTALTCEQIAAERVRISETMAADTARIDGNRTRNQVAGYVGALSLVTLPVLGATEGNYAEKDDIKRLYARHDALIRLAAVKTCPPEK
jgi:hypothetical protein